MSEREAAAQFKGLSKKVEIDEYNFEHFRTKHLARDGKRTATNRGILPGEFAPDFELQQAGGGSLRLSSLRGRPVLLHFGSIS